MAKYSTGSDNTSVDNSCQLCGAEDASLSVVEIAGASVTVCKDCRSTTSADSERQDNSASKNEPRKSSLTGDTPGYTLSQPNPNWAYDVEYGNAETPHLKPEYSGIVDDALAANDMTIEGLAEETGVDEKQLEAVLDGEATRARVTLDELREIEVALDISLVDEMQER